MSENSRKSAMGASQESSEKRSMEMVQMVRTTVAVMKDNALGMERGRSVDDIMAVVGE